MKGWKCALLDLDGTIIDSKPGITKSVQYALSFFGITEPNTQLLEAYIGPPLLESFTRCHQLDPRQAAEAVDHFRRFYKQKGMMDHTLYPGISSLLSMLAESGMDVYLATSKATVFAEEIIRYNELDVFFKGIYGSFLDGRRTEKAEVIRAVVHEHQLEHESTIMVGDRKHDVEGARNNGIETIGVLYGYGSAQELKDAGAAYTVRSVEELKQILQAGRLNERRDNNSF